jgi:hypothetical protein
MLEGNGAVMSDPRIVGDGIDNTPMDRLVAACDWLEQEWLNDIRALGQGQMDEDTFRTRQLTVNNTVLAYILQQSNPELLYPDVGGNEDVPPTAPPFEEPIDGRDTQGNWVDY